jgi:hypothetical protein
MTLRVVGDKPAKVRPRVAVSPPKPKPMRRGPWLSAVFVIEYRKQNYSVVWNHWSCEVVPLGTSKPAKSFTLDPEDKPRVTDSIHMIERYVGLRGSRAERRLGRRQV